MSNLSLLSGVYANVEGFASLVDDVIQSARINAQGMTHGSQTRLGKLLIETGDQQSIPQSYEALVLESLLRNSNGRPLADLAPLGRRLLSGPISPSDQALLEILAKKLERERSEVISRLRGRG